MSDDLTTVDLWDQPTELVIDELSATGRLCHLIEERDAIRRRRASGEPRPWTQDPILQRWHFCNVRREYDRVTRWITENWREPHSDDPDLWFAMAVARFVNWPDSLREIGWPVPWNQDAFTAAMVGRAQRGETTFGPAYIILPTGCRGPREESVAKLLGSLWGAHSMLRPKPGQSLQAWHAQLTQRRGLANFMAAQIVADMKYVKPLKSATDWWTFAASGNGSKRGLNRITGRPLKKAWDEYHWRRALKWLHSAIAPDLMQRGIDRLCAQDLEHCVCEFDKYERARLGQGTPKRRFVPTTMNDTAC